MQETSFLQSHCIIIQPKEGAECIRESGCLRKLEGAVKDANFGDGVSFTSIAPMVTKQRIAKNNWNAAGRSSAMKLVKHEKLDYYIAVEFQRNDRKLKDVSYLSRDILLYLDDVVF